MNPPRSIKDTAAEGVSVPGQSEKCFLRGPTILPIASPNMVQPSQSTGSKVIDHQACNRGPDSPRPDSPVRLGAPARLPSGAWAEKLQDLKRECQGCESGARDEKLKTSDKTGRWTGDTFFSVYLGEAPPKTFFLTCFQVTNIFQQTNRCG